MKVVFLVFMSVFSVLTYGQLDGIWIVEKVNVGSDEMTPHAKWFEFGDNAMLKGGNGGVINIRGTFEMLDQNHFIFKDESGKEDEMGPFTLNARSEDDMTWIRTEEGMEVKIFLTSSNSIPQASWDKIVGQWNEETSVKGIQYNFRWDRFFVKIVDGRKEWGIWHIHAHKPELRLMYFDKDSIDDIWILKIDEDMMGWKSSDGEKSKHLKKKN